MALYLGYVRVIWFDCIAPTGDLNRLNIINRSEHSDAPYHSIDSQSRRRAFDRHTDFIGTAIILIHSKLTIDSHLVWHTKRIRVTELYGRVATSQYKRITFYPSTSAAYDDSEETKAIWESASTTYWNTTITNIQSHEFVLRYNLDWCTCHPFLSNASRECPSFIVDCQR